MQFTPAKVGAGMTERWYGFLMQFTPAKLVPAKAGSRGRNDKIFIGDKLFHRWHFALSNEHFHINT